MRLWKNPGPTSSILMAFLLSYCILTSISQTSLFEVEGQRLHIISLQGKNDDLRIDGQNMANKLREVTGEKIPNDYIVVMKDDFLSSVWSLAGEAKSEGATVQHVYDHVLPGFTIKVPNVKVLEAIAENPEVDYVQPDVKVKAFVQSLPTGVDRVDGDLSSTKSGNGTGDVNVDIGILDTGIDLDHPDLNVYRQISFVPGTASGNDDDGHGTAVAGVAAAKDNTQGVVGLAPGARLWAIKVLDSNGIGSSSDIIKGIDYVTEHANEIDVVNLSFGAVGKNDALHNAIIKSVAAGVTYTAAAGNEGMDASSVFPANFPEVMAVSAIVDIDGKCGGVSSIITTAGKDDTFASFS
ncbi:MAG TPA: S8 family serine peptidase, partial [Nitrososphaeraceae archaeon]